MCSQLFPFFLGPNFKPWNSAAGHNDGHWDGQGGTVLGHDDGDQHAHARAAHGAHPIGHEPKPIGTGSSGTDDPNFGEEITPGQYIKESNLTGEIGSCEIGFLVFQMLWLFSSFLVKKQKTTCWSGRFIGPRHGDPGQKEGRHPHSRGALAPEHGPIGAKDGQTCDANHQAQS